MSGHDEKTTTRISTGRAGAVLAGATLVEVVAKERLFSMWKGTRSGKPCAVYVLEPGADELARARFAEGAARMKELEGAPNLLHVHEVAADGCAFSAELHDTGTVAHLPKLSWPIGRRIELVRTLCDVVGALHEKSLVHGNLRPASLLLDEQLHLVVADVGLVDVTAELAGDEKDSMGFGVYCAPEAATGGELDGRSDIYSIGRILHFILVGFAPEPVFDEVPRLDSMAVLPANLTRIVRKCVMPEPGARYATTAELSADLARYRDPVAVGIALPGDDAAGPRSIPGRASMPSASSPTPSSPSSPKILPPRTPISLRGAPSTGKKKNPSDGAGAPLDLPRTARLGAAAAGGAMLVVLGVLAFLGPAGGALRVPCLALAALALGAVTLAAPVDAKSPRTRRALYFLVVAALTAVADPTSLAADAFASMRVKKGGGAANADGFRSLVALGNIDFTEIDLHGANLSGATLTRLSLKRADLSNVNFANANLAWTAVDGANLSGADLTGVDGQMLFGLERATCSAATKMPTGWRCDGAKAALIKK